MLLPRRSVVAALRSIVLALGAASLLTTTALSRKLHPERTCLVVKAALGVQFLGGCLMGLTDLALSRRARSAAAVVERTVIAPSLFWHAAGHTSAALKLVLVACYLFSQTPRRADHPRFLMLAHAAVATGALVAAGSTVGLALATSALVAAAARRESQRVWRNAAVSALWLLALEGACASSCTSHRPEYKWLRL